MKRVNKSTSLDYLTLLSPRYLWVKHYVVCLCSIAITTILLLDHDWLTTISTKEAFESEYLTVGNQTLTILSYWMTSYLVLGYITLWYTLLSLCCWRFESAKQHTCSTEKTLLQDVLVILWFDNLFMISWLLSVRKKHFLIILKQMLQNNKKISKKCFLSTICIVMFIKRLLHTDIGH